MDEVILLEYLGRFTRILLSKLNGRRVNTNSISQIYTVLKSNNAVSTATVRDFTKTTKVNGRENIAKHFLPKNNAK